MEMDGMSASRAPAVGVAAVLSLLGAFAGISQPPRRAAALVTAEAKA
jgi:hypothetical protein